MQIQILKSNGDRAVLSFIKNFKLGKNKILHITYKDGSRDVIFNVIEMVV